MLLVAAVVMVDQGTKWSAGHSADYMVNGGVDRDGPRLLDGVWRNVAAGGALDLADLLLLAGLATVAVRARGMVRAGLLLYTAGWASNLADRLGASYLTAPAAHPRGVVDLLALGGRNVADYACKGGMLLLALAAVLHAVGGLPGVSRGLDALARRARRTWRPALAVVVAALAGLWVGAAGQAGAVRAARADAHVLEQFAFQRGVVLPGCRPDHLLGPGRATYRCPVRLPGGQHRVLRLTPGRPSLTAPAAPTVTVTTTSRRK